MGANDRVTPVIRVRVKLPGKPSPERIAALEDQPGNASRVQKLTFEDNDKAADKAKLEIQNWDLKFPDDPTFDRGNRLYLSWGYEGNLSPERELVITDWTPGPVFGVEALAKAVLMNRFPVDESYYGQSYSDVANKIAKRNGYAGTALHIQDVPFKVESIIQPNMSDAQFMRQLAKKLGFLFFVDGSGFHFHPRAYGQASRKTITYGVDLMAFPSFEKAPAAQPGAVTAKAKDPITKKKIEERADNASLKGRPGLATQMEVYDKRTGEASLRPDVAKESVVAMTGSPAEVKAKAAGLAAKSLGVPKKCTVPVRGDPQFQAKTILTMKGIGRRLSGNYYCAQAMHTVEPGKYDMALKLVRDGTNGSGGPGAGAAKSSAKANDTQGPAAAGLVATETYNTKTGAGTTSYGPAGPGKGNK